ncbi:MAG: PilZ domain-containing protein [Candidatus Omnitrophota bacterium]
MSFSADKRKFPRIARDDIVSYRSLSQPGKPAQAINNISMDLSSGGIRFISYEFFPLGDRLRLEIRLKEELIELTGRVVRVKEMYNDETFEVSLEFTSIDKDDIMKLKKILG